MIKETNKRIMITISKEEYSKLEKLAEADCRKATNLATKIIRDYLKDK